MEKIIPVETMQRLSLGRQGEHLTRTITFDFASWQNRYGTGSIQLQVQRPGEAAPYPVPLQVDGNLAMWRIEQRDTAKAGEGKLQLLYIVGGESVTKSHIFITSITAGLSQPGSVTSAEQSFLDKVVQTAGRAECAAQTVEMAVQQTAKDAKQTSKDRIAAEYAQEQAMQAAAATVKDKATAESAAKIAVQTVEGFDQHATAQTEQFNVLGNELKEAVAQDKESAQAAAEQVNRDANTVNKLVDVVLQQAEVTQKAVADAKAAADCSEAGAAKVEETVAGYNANLIERLCMPFSAVEPVVTCHPVAGYPLQVVSQIEQIQQGRSDFSSENLQSMKGWTEAKLVRCGKNRIRFPNGHYKRDSVVEKNGITFAVNADGSVRVSGKATATATFDVGYDYFGIQGGSSDAENGKLDGYAISGVPQGKAGVNVVYLYRQPPALPVTYIRVSSGVTVDTIVYPQIEVGTVVTKYEPYQGNRYTVQFGETVESGSYDWGTGLLTITAPVQKTKQLLPQQILALFGTNTLYSDTGKTTVHGHSDLKYEMQQLKDAIAALGAV